MKFNPNYEIHMKKNNQSGFTLVEVIVVLAVVLLLTGIAIPMVGGYIEDGRRARAEAEIKTLTAAVVRFNNDTGTWPTRSSAGKNNTVYSIITGDPKPGSNPWTGGHSLWSWGNSATRGDTLDNHLLKNKPGGAKGGAYPTTGNVKWRGPYLAGPAPLDPWGRPYVLNVISSFYNHNKNYKRVFFLSAGPNGKIDTAAAATNKTVIGGDDIGVIVNER